MNRTRWCVRSFLGFMFIFSPALFAEPIRRGDANLDGFVDLNDVVGILRSLYGRETAACLFSADANADGKLDLADAIQISQQIFSGKEAFASLVDDGEELCLDPETADPEEVGDLGVGGGSSFLWQDDFNSQPVMASGKYILTAPSGAIRATTLSSRACLMVRCDAGQARDSNGRVRSELTLWEPGRKSKIFQRDPIGSERWYAFSLFVPTSWWYDDNKVQIAQWHGTEDPGETGMGRNPPLSIMVNRSQLVIRQLWSARRIQTANENRVDIWKGPLERGKWLNFVFHMKWSYGTDGFLEIWKNGTKIITQRNHPNTYNDALGPYFNLGIYWPGALDRSAYNSTDRHTIYYDGFRIGDGRNVFTDMPR